MTVFLFIYIYIYNPPLSLSLCSCVYVCTYRNLLRFVWCAKGSSRVTICQRIIPKLYISTFSVKG